jgi:hypothetical protein
LVFLGGLTASELALAPSDFVWHLLRMGKLKMKDFFF